MVEVVLSLKRIRRVVYDTAVARARSCGKGLCVGIPSGWWLPQKLHVQSIKGFIIYSQNGSGDVYNLRAIVVNDTIKMMLTLPKNYVEEAGIVAGSKLVLSYNMDEELGAVVVVAPAHLVSSLLFGIVSAFL